MTVTGNIYENGTKKSVNNASIEVVQISTGVQVGKPFQLSSNSYQTWSDLDPNDTGVIFTAPGYIKFVIPLSILADMPDVYLDKTVHGGLILAAAAAGVLLLSTSKKKPGRNVGTVSPATVPATTSRGISFGDVEIGLLIVGGILGYKAIKGILKKLGLLANDNVDHEAIDPNSAWKPTYWQQFTSYSYAITESTAKGYASQIHNAFGVLQDDYNKIKAVFDQCRTKANVSFIAYWFSKQYGEDLLSFLTDGGGILPWDGLSSSHMDQLITQVKNLPSN
jgi:hypothetical protein